MTRLRTDPFHFGRENYVSVHKKGRNGGKFRKVPTRPDTRAIVEEYKEFRRSIIIGCKDIEILLVHKWNGKLKDYQKTGIDKILSKISMRSGIQFSNHDLRRTCGRRMYRSEVRIEEIAGILGHSDTKVTLKYLGLDRADLSGAMDQYYQYYQKTLFPKTEIINKSQCESGQGGIHNSSCPDKYSASSINGCSRQFEPASKPISFFFY